MSSEDETRKLLKLREDLEFRIGRLQTEVEDLRKAVAEIDKHIVRQGFRQPLPSTVRPKPLVEGDTDGEDQSSVKSKDGTILGTLRMDESEIVFEPRGDLVFVTSIPPFQSFFVERVLDNMKSTDEERAALGEISADVTLSYDVITDRERILQILIRNYGGERRLREIQSSLRWAFEKMHEKLGQG